MSERKGPALAGLFFALSFLHPLYTADLPRLSGGDQQYFRRFIEVFTPTLLGRERETTAVKTHSAGHYRWDKKNRDCAGLVRYLFWEAMQAHNDAFLQQYPAMRSLAVVNPPSGLMRLRPAWNHDNLTAVQLVARSRNIGRDLPARALKTGDLLYFQSAELKIRHIMLVIRSGSALFLVYHTGDDRDELRIRTFADITALPETQWHPEPQNPVFRGIYRPQFLD